MISKAFLTTPLSFCFQHFGGVFAFCRFSDNQKVFSFNKAVLKENPTRKLPLLKEDKIEFLEKDLNTTNIDEFASEEEILLGKDLLSKTRMSETSYMEILTYLTSKDFSQRKHSGLNESSSLDKLLNDLQLVCTNNKRRKHGKLAQQAIFAVSSKIEKIEILTQRKLSDEMKRKLIISWALASNSGINLPGIKDFAKEFLLESPHLFENKENVYKAPFVFWSFLKLNEADFEVIEFFLEFLNRNYIHLNFTQLHRAFWVLSFIPFQVHVLEAQKNELKERGNASKVRLDSEKTMRKLSQILSALLFRINTVKEQKKKIIYNRKSAQNYLQIAMNLSPSAIFPTKKVIWGTPKLPSEIIQWLIENFEISMGFLMMNGQTLQGSWTNAPDHSNAASFFAPRSISWMDFPISRLSFASVRIHSYGESSTESRLEGNAKSFLKKAADDIGVSILFNQTVGVYEVDALVGGRLILEVNGWGHFVRGIEKQDQLLLNCALRFEHLKLFGDYVIENINVNKWEKLCDDEKEKFVKETIQKHLK